MSTMPPAAPDLLALTMTDAAGTASMRVRIPPTAALVGASVFHAWLAVDVDAPKNALDVVTSGGLRVDIGSAAR